MSYVSEILADSPVVFYRLGEGSGTSAADASGNSHTGTYAGSGVTYGVTGAIGDGNTAVTFNGSTGEMDSGVDAAVKPGTGDFTVECWVKITASGVNIAAGKFGGSGNNYWLGVGPIAPDLMAHVANFSVSGAGGAVTVTGDVTVDDGNWHHLVGVREGDTVRLYVDGALDDSETGSSGVPGNVQPSGNLFVGQFGSSAAFPFAGSLDEAAYYASALSSGRVAAHFSAASNSGAYTRVDDTSPDGTDIMVLVPDDYDAVAGAHAIIYHHGVGESQTALLSDALKEDCVNALAEAGYILAGSNAAGENWGNQAGMDAYVSLYAYLVENYRVKKVLFWSQSMGGCTGLLCLADERFPVVGWYGTYPVCNLGAMFDGNAGTFASAIRTAFGIASDGSDYSTKTGGHDPVLLDDTDYPVVGFRFTASPSDTVVDKADNSDTMSALIDSRMPESEVVICTGNHGDPSHFQPSDMVDFFARCVNRTVTSSGPVQLIDGGLVR